MRYLIYGMIYLGSALMLYNIIQYHRFTKKMAWMAIGRRNRTALFTPQVFMILFFAGYLTVGIFGKPDLVIASILFGGSIFVFIMLTMLIYITDRIRENERELSSTRQASEAKSIFLSNMSHDIRTPMNAIIGYTQLALRDGVSEEQMREYLGKIDASSEHLLGLINDVLEMSRIESGNLETEEIPTDLRTVLTGVSDLFASQIEKKHIRYTADTSGLSDPFVICDRKRLNRILLNLMSNACKFTPEGGEISVRLAQTGRREGQGIYEIRVKDNGIGMSPEFAEKVFDSFERERTSTVSGIQGTGLGMAITKKFTDLMGGSISLDTEQGKGTEFTVTLPFRITDSLPEATTSLPCRDHPSGDPGSIRLLLAEDNPINREIASMILTDTGFMLETAENGQIALDMVKQNEPGYYDAVLMDVQMPVMGGLEATRLIRALPDPVRASVPVIAMTANAFREDIEKEKDAGMNAHISKPLEISDMMATLAEILCD
ncbi:MAG: response regulator [Lachnospiraceae bacterium]|nr:response regulator [Lachnospiraceae bacterium]